MAKRERGYMVTVKAFLPVNPKDTKDTIAKATALDSVAESKGLSQLAAAGAVVVSVNHRYTSREKPPIDAAQMDIEEVTNEPQTVDPQSTGPGSGGDGEEAEVDDEPQSEGEAQSEAIEEVASGRRGRRAA